jgi:3-dehydroquinate synthase/shikimate kinase/3-dehydroquinate synthase
MKTIKLQINTNEHRYPVIIGSGLVKKLSNLINKNSIKFDKCLLVIDKRIPKNLLHKIIKSLSKKKKIIHFFNANESNKNQSSVNKILQILLKNNFHRSDCIISVGGGITGDVVGFASSIFKRGINFINIPTTLLAQVDSSIGGKTGVNCKHGKNLIGSFHQPLAVIADTMILKSLPNRELKAGFSEVIKYGLIKDKKFFEWLEENYTKILDYNICFISSSTTISYGNLFRINKHLKSLHNLRTNTKS